MSTHSIYKVQCGGSMNYSAIRQIVKVIFCYFVAATQRELVVQINRHKYTVYIYKFTAADFKNSTK